MIKAKRFWKDVSVEARADGFVVLLDGRVVKTPAKADLTVPTKQLAELIAVEWRAVEGEIRPSEMHFTKMSNSAKDRVLPNRQNIEEMLAEYVDTDLLSFRATQPEKLVARQKVWDEWVAWAKPHSIALEVTNGIMPIAQPKSNKRAAKAYLERLSVFELVAMHEYITILGSFVLAMALFEGDIEAEKAFLVSRIDEDFQAEQWGEDEEAASFRADKADALLRAVSFHCAAQ